MEDEREEPGDGTKEVVSIAQTTWGLRLREIYCLELLEASHRGGRNASADDGDYGHKPSESRGRSELAKSDIERCVEARKLVVEHERKILTPSTTVSDASACRVRREDSQVL